VSPFFSKKKSKSKSFQHLKQKSCIVMSVTESPKSYLQAVMQGLEVPEVPQAAEEPNFQLEEPKVPPEVTVVKSSWDLLLESKSLNEKEKKKKKEKKVVRLSLKAPAGAEKDFSTNTAGGKREPRQKHAAGEKCFSSKADCKGVSSGSYRCISCKVRYVLKLSFLN
jgi:hypothetical protein